MSVTALNSLKAVNDPNTIHCTVDLKKQIFTLIMVLMENWEICKDTQLTHLARATRGRCETTFEAQLIKSKAGHLLREQALQLFLHLPPANAHTRASCTPASLTRALSAPQAAINTTGTISATVTISATARYQYHGHYHCHGHYQRHSHYQYLWEVRVPT